jgi:hypothetical protein
MEYPDHVRALAGERPDLAREVGCFTSISGVLDWMRRRGLCRASVDIVGQDEFEYDFLIQLEPTGPWVAFGVT